MFESQNSVEEPTPLLTAQEAAAFLRIPIASLYGRVAKRQIPCIKLGRLLRFKRTELNQLLAANTSQIDPGPYPLDEQV
jgi:excisionase family DNA binding protein